MQLNALRYFVMVATTGSFAATAKHFQVPPSSVSRFISGLEQEIGQQLFYRNLSSMKYFSFLASFGKLAYLDLSNKPL